MKYLSILFMCFCIVFATYKIANANTTPNYKHNLYREAKKLEAERDYHANKEQEHKQIKEVKKEEAIKKWGEYIETKSDTISLSSVIPQVRGNTTYKTSREEHLYTKVEKTVDLPGFGDYQDLLASYAYNTCRGTKGIVQKNNGYLYDCQTWVLILNSENGGWNKDAIGAMNGNGTVDGGLPQLNSSIHAPFINSPWFKNPMAQLDYGIGVLKDASEKGVMPWYGYYKRHERDKGIKFLK